MVYSRDSLRALIGIVILGLMVPLATSAPSGIGTAANDGCLCHGEKNSDTLIDIQGLPDSFESNTSYNFSINVYSPNIPMNGGGEAGGFRLLITDGSISFDSNEGLIQEMDEGWTHTEAGNAVRTWNLTFTSPQDNASFVDFTIYGNAVNGNQATTGDEWNAAIVRLPGVVYDGDLLEGASDEFSPMDYSVGLISLLALTYLLVTTVRN